MSLDFTPLHPMFAAAVSAVELRMVTDAATLAEIRAGMDRYAVLVFREQPFTDEEQVAFARRLDGALHTKTGASALYKSRLGTEALADISNVDEAGELLKSDDRRRAYSLGNRLWHTDASFVDPAGRYSMLHARVIPPAGMGDTEFADMRAAYDALAPDVQARLERLSVHHSIAHSRQTLGFEFSKDEEEALRGAMHRLIRTIPGSGRRALYLASHARASSRCRYPRGASSCAISSSMRPSASSCIATRGASATWSSGTTAARCIARPRSTTRSTAASFGASPRSTCRSRSPPPRVRIRTPPSPPVPERGRSARRPRPRPLAP
jgi:alpha-ketoglutarate-dependent 2,4-dichlorophenoxyacetate dioxygenase